MARHVNQKSQDATNMLGELGFLVDIWTVASTKTLSEDLEQFIADGVMEEWTRLVDERLDTSRDEYATAMQPPEVSNHVLTLTLEGSALAVAIEDGAPSFDMKGDNKRLVPFTFADASPGDSSKGVQGFSAPFAARNRRDSDDIGTAIAKVAKTLAKGESIESSLASGLRNRTTRTAHRGDLFSGMAKTPREHKRLGANKMEFSTIRTSSPNSKPGAWIHPGFEPRHLMDDALERIEELADNYIQSLLMGVEIASSTTPTGANMPAFRQRARRK